MGEELGRSEALLRRLPPNGADSALPNRRSIRSRTRRLDQLSECHSLSRWKRREYRYAALGRFAFVRRSYTSRGVLALAFAAMQLTHAPAFARVVLTPASRRSTETTSALVDLQSRTKRRSSNGSEGQQR